MNYVRRNLTKKNRIRFIPARRELITEILMKTYLGTSARLNLISVIRMAQVNNSGTILATRTIVST